MSKKLNTSTGDTFKNALRGDRSQAVAIIIRVSDETVRFKYATGVIDEIEMALFESMIDGGFFTDYEPKK